MQRWMRNRKLNNTHFMQRRALDSLVGLSVSCALMIYILDFNFCFQSFKLPCTIYIIIHALNDVPVVQIPWTKYE